MRKLAIIPARGGSKGIPHKNIVDVCGKPLIGYTIEAALTSNCFDLVVVTTDDDDIEKIALTYGITVLRRPDFISGDDAKTEDAIKHAIEELMRKGDVFDVFMLLQPTSPLRTSENISGAMNLFVSKRLRSLLSVCLQEHPAQKCLLLKSSESNEVEPIRSWGELSMPRQELAKSYRANGAIYINHIHDFISSHSLYNAPVMAFEMTERDGVDVDTFLDLKKVKSIIGST